MARYKVAVLSSPVAGEEEEYHRWYEDVHLADVLKTPGVVAAERYNVTDGYKHKHLAAYELETENPDVVVAEMLARAGTPLLPESPGLDAAAGYDIIKPAPVGTRQAEA